MIPRPALTAWRRISPWRDDLQVEQDLLLSRLAIDVANHPATSGMLVWRGGTCLHKLHLPTARRYSVDLDYVLLGGGDHGQIARVLAQVAAAAGFDNVRTTVTSTRVNVQASADATAGGRLTVKVEVNCHDVPPLFDLIRLPLAVETRWWEGAADVRTFQPAELLGTKLRALAQRRKGRDLADLSLARRELAVVDEDLALAADHYLRHEDPPVTPGMLRAALAGHVRDPSFVNDLDDLVTTPLEGFAADVEAHRLILWTDRYLDPLFNARRSRNAVRREHQQAEKHGYAPGLIQCPGFELLEGNLSRCVSWLQPGDVCRDHPGLPTDL
jgi:predicted nucleotidyltransferase component of viral defense system